MTELGRFMPGERVVSVAALVLAAGSSRRMGENKLLLELEGEPVVRRCVKQAIAAGLEPVVVVLGYEAQPVRQALQDLPCRAVTNPHYHRGVNRSLLTGVSALPKDVSAVVVMLADMPLVTADMLGGLVERYRKGQAPLIVSQYGEVLAPPMLYDRALFGELGAPGGEGCGKRVVRRHRAEAQSVRWPTEALTDLDDPADYERLKTLVVHR